MPRRFLNSTETALVSLVKKVMQRHKPYGPGLRRSFINFVRSFSVGSKPRDAHSLSVLVTEDLLVEVTNEFDSADISSSFVNVMSLADEEVLGHYSRSGRSPFFASMLTELLEELKTRGSYYNNEWDLSFFQGFVSRFLFNHKENLSNEHLNQALEILISPGHYRLLSVNWLLLRFLAAGYVEVARGASGVQQGFVASSSSQTRASLRGVFTSGHEEVDNDRETVEAVRSSETLSNMQDGSQSQHFGLLFVLPERESLKCMLEDEVEAMMSLYSLVLFGQYVNEEYQTSKTYFKQAYPAIDWILMKCGALLGRIGSASMVFYMGSMVGAILAMVSGEMGQGESQGTANLSALQKYVGMVESVFTNMVYPRATSNSTGNTLTEIFASAQAPRLQNYSAMPASLSVLIIMYLSIPIIMFGGFASKWISSKIESRGGARFVQPKLMSPIVVTQGFRLVLNTLLTGTAHIAERATNEFLNWTVKRIYLPISLTSQPAKTTSFINAAMAASPTNRHRQVTLSTKKCIIATLLAIPPEFGVHALTNAEQLGYSYNPTLKVVGLILNTILKCGRICGLFAPSLYARKYTPDDYAYSSYFEQLLWIDGVKAITAPAVLIGLDLAVGPLASTIVLTLDSLVSFIPDIMLGIRYDMLNKTASKLTALNTWLYRNNLSSQEVLKLAAMATLEDVPGAAQASLMYMLEKRLKKNIVQDLGMDLILDNPEQEAEELGEEIEEQEERTLPSQVIRATSYGSTAQERNTKLPNRKQRAGEIELTDLSMQSVLRNNREALTIEELEPLQRGLVLGDFKSLRADNRSRQGAFSSIGDRMFERAEALMQKVRSTAGPAQHGSSNSGRIYIGARDSDDALSVSRFCSQQQPDAMFTDDSLQCPRDSFISSVPRYAQDSTRSSGQRFDRRNEGTTRPRLVVPVGPSNLSSTFSDSTSDVFLSPTGESLITSASMYTQSLSSIGGAEDEVGINPVKRVGKAYPYQSCTSTDSSDTEEQYQGRDYEDVGLENEEDSHEEEYNVVSTSYKGDVRKGCSGSRQQENYGSRLTDVHVASGGASHRGHEGRPASPGGASRSHINR